MTKIVINLDDEDYTEICKCSYPNDVLVGELIYQVRNNKPLPKGHGDLKDADALGIRIAVLRDKYNFYGNEYEHSHFEAYDNAVDEIIDAPTIIEADEEKK